jgi:hypothetical protein
MGGAKSEARGSTGRVWARSVGHTEGGRGGPADGPLIIYISIYIYNWMVPDPYRILFHEKKEKRFSSTKRNENKKGRLELGPQLF